MKIDANKTFEKIDNALSDLAENANISELSLSDKKALSKDLAACIELAKAAKAKFA